MRAPNNEPGDPDNSPSIRAPAAESDFSPPTPMLVLAAATASLRRNDRLIVLAVAVAIFIGCMVSPPGLMDDIDAAQTQVARNMLDSGNWVTVTLDSVRYFDKPPFKYWLTAVSFAIFGVHDWASRIPIVLSAIALCWLGFEIGVWAFSPRAGRYAGLILATCVGLFLFTRVAFIDVLLSAAVTLAVWSFLRALDAAEPRQGTWASVMAVAIGIGVLTKGFVALVLPVGAAAVFLVVTGEWRRRESWRRLHPFRGILIIAAVAGPWHILATIQNPPYFDFTLKGGPGYRGFFWYWIINEHILRFLNERYPRDYSTVPRHLFWLFHLLWLFPWSVYLPAVWKLSFSPPANDRARRTLVMCLCWAGFTLLFFTFSSTQEYYTMPAYPALALLIARALTDPAAAAWARWGQRVLAGIAGLAFVAILFILTQVWSLPAPGDISRALVPQAAEAYTLSLGHMGDLSLNAFAYLRLPLILAGVAFLIGALLIFRARVAAAVVMMILFAHAARLALVTFEPYLGSRALAEALDRAPHGNLILDDQYFTFSSVVFYAEMYHADRIRLLNGRKNNLEYGSYAPDAPQDVFIDDGTFRELWRSPNLYYVCVESPDVARLKSLAEPSRLYEVVASGGKFVFSNREISPSWHAYN